MVAKARPRFAIHGTLGSFVKFGLDPQESQMKAGMLPGATGFGEIPPAEHGKIYHAHGTINTIQTMAGDYRNFYAEIASAISNKSPPPVTAADAVTGLKLLELARKSSKEGRTLAWPA